MATWHISGLDLDRLIDGTHILIPNCSAPCCNFEIIVFAVPAIGDIVQFEDGRLARLTSVRPCKCPNYILDDSSGLCNISHYECEYIRIPAIEQDILKTKGGD